jgi:hypothetical protein
MLQKLPAFYGTRRFSAVLTKARHYEEGRALKLLLGSVATRREEKVERRGVSKRRHISGREGYNNFRF